VAGIAPLHVCQVATRAILYEARLVLDGECEMYVDDGIGCVETALVSSDMEKFDNICCDLLNSPEAIQRSKDEQGQRLQTGMVSVARKNLLRALWGFVSLNIDGVQTIKRMQRLASWASRYSMICVELRPFTRALHRSASGWRNPRATFELVNWRCL
jgi:hypothetical protein